MKKTIVILAGITGVLLVLGLAAGAWAVQSVFAQAPTPPTSDSLPAGAWGGGRGSGMGCGFMQEQVADVLGMTVEDLQAERAAGKTLGEIADEKGVSDEVVIDAMLAMPRDMVALAVKYERITQEQADWLEDVMNAMAPFMLTNPFGPNDMPAMMHGGMGQGGNGMSGGMHGRMGGMMMRGFMGGGAPATAPDTATQ